MESLFAYHSSPAGYPRLGLVARTFDMPNRRHATAAALKHRLTRWERERGNTTFTVIGLEKLTPEQRMEMVTIYVSLRERYPAVRADRLEFGARGLTGKVGDSYVYAANFPLLRKVLTEGGMPGTPETYRFARAIASTVGRGARELVHEIDATADVRVNDVTAAGSIRISISATSDKGRRGIQSTWAASNASRLRRSLPASVLPTEVSLAALTLVHEFGHLVDGTVTEFGPETVDRVYGALSAAVLGGERPHLYQWRKHLANYPVWLLEGSAGPVAGGRSRAAATRAALGPIITDTLGTYAATSRDELFAESFMLCWVTADPALRSALTLFRDELVATGIARPGKARKPRVKTKDSGDVVPAKPTAVRHHGDPLRHAETFFAEAPTEQQADHIGQLGQVRTVNELLNEQESSTR